MYKAVKKEDNYRPAPPTSHCCAYLKLQVSSLTCDCQHQIHQLRGAKTLITVSVQRDDNLHTDVSAAAAVCVSRSSHLCCF